MNTLKGVLIVDDEDIIVKGLQYLISANFRDYIIKGASSLKELDQSLIANEYTHLILDLNLKDGNSIDILPRLTIQYPDLSILIHSMVSDKETIDKLMQFKIAGFLNKRSGEKEVLNTLQNFLNKGCRDSNTPEEKKTNYF
ncbi:response regulator [Ferruginibacter albus]|uniref:response regulator n=1 Tax=Ferruginibacter albus TaxID=2875540 RepID=UPI001CC55959|nr:response regulator [Ferruginibacter albus]UAY52292.1 response regulator [Ferruginibacter albus]